jgi:YaiO family outer membrane protein
MMHVSTRTMFGLAIVVFTGAQIAAQVGDWQASVRAAVERRDLESATAIVATRLSNNPSDLEARAWRARLLAWNGHTAQAESEYRAVLEKAPHDIDVLTGLADTLVWQNKLSEALEVLDRSPSGDTAVLVRRGRALARLNRNQEAIAAYREVLRRDPNNTDAKTGLASLREEPRHELRVGSDTDRFNYTDAATAQSFTLTSHWDSRWTTGFTSTWYQRFGNNAQRVTARVSRKLSARSWIGLSGGAGHDEGVIPKREAGLEIGRAFRFTGMGFVRGAELAYDQQWLWFTGSKVLVISGSSLLYLPRDCTFALTVAAARSSFHLPEIQWRPSGSARLTFPLHSSRLKAHLGFAVGTENFAKADELGHFSARTFSGGLRYQLTRTQDIAGIVAFQDRSQGRTQTSVGISYGIRF